MEHALDQDLKTPWIRTPLVRSTALSRAAGCNIFLKLENMQPSGSFKSRGVGNFLRSRLADALRAGESRDLPEKSEAETAPPPPPPSRVHFYISSGGNAGLGCVHAATTLGSAASVVVPLSTSDSMIGKIRTAGAEEVIQHGRSWAEADRYLTEHVLPKARAAGQRQQQHIYVPPFDAPEVWEGNAGIVREAREQLRGLARHYPVKTRAASNNTAGRADAAAGPEELSLDAVVCSVGGGGLFCGVMKGLDEIDASRPPVKVLAVETVGAESLAESVKQGMLVTLPAITSIATSLGARTVCRQALDYATRTEQVVPVVLTDAEAVAGCLQLLEDERVLVEPACGVCAAVCLEGRLRKFLPELTEDSNVMIVVCGGSNMSLDLMNDYREKFLS